MTNRYWILFAAGLSMASACHSATEPGGDGTVRLDTDRRQYSVGETIHVVVTNRGEKEVGFNFCMGGTFTHISTGTESPRPSYDCTANLNTIEPHRSVEIPVLVTPDWLSGDYRASLSVEVGVQTYDVVNSPTFKVIAK